MSVDSLCAVCESREADRTCDRCGRGVCIQHYEEASGLCLNCTDTTGSGSAQLDDPAQGDAGDDAQF